MPTLISILSDADIKTFETPPIFNEEELVNYFSPPQWAREFIKTLRTPSNKTGFVLMMVYFRATNKFFGSDEFHKADINFVVKTFGLKKREVKLTGYEGGTYHRHRERILQQFGFQKFDNRVQSLIDKEAESLAESIDEAVQVIEKELYETISKYLSDDHKGLLDSLLKKSDDSSDDQINLKFKRYKITLLKRISQSTRPSKIRQNVADLNCLKEIFDDLQPVINSINLSPKITSKNRL